MGDQGSGLAAGGRGSGGLEHYLERLTEELGKARGAGHPAAASSSTIRRPPRVRMALLAASRPPHPGPA